MSLAGAVWLVAAALGCSSAPPSPVEPTPTASGDAEDAPGEVPGSPSETSAADPGYDLLEGAPAQPAEGPATGSITSIRPRITIRPESVVPSAKAAEVRFELRLENTGSEPVEAPWGETSLLLDGRPMSDWAELVASLPAKVIAPKQAAQLEYRPSDKAVIKPGIYELVFVVGKTRSEPATLTVTKD